MNEGLWTSTDGVTWNHDHAQGIPNTTKIQFFPTKIGDVYYLGTWGSGLYTSTDGTHWTQNKKVPQSADIYSNVGLVGGIYYLPTIGDGLWYTTA